MRDDFWNGKHVYFRLGEFAAFWRVEYRTPALFWDYGGYFGPFWFYTYLRDMWPDPRIAPSFRYGWAYLHLRDMKTIYVGLRAGPERVWHWLARLAAEKPGE